MKKFLQDHGKSIVRVGAVVAACSPLLASASGFGSGMIIPTGTTTLVTGSFTTYFFPTILATIFQQQVIEIVVVTAAVYVMWRILRSVWGRLRHPGN